MKPTLPREVNSILSALNRSKGQPIIINPDGSVWTVVEKTTKVPTKINMGKGQKNMEFTQSIKSTEKGEYLGNICSFLEDLPLPVTSVFESLVGRKKNFQKFGSPSGKLGEIGSTNSLRNSQIPIWQDAVDFHSEYEREGIQTQYGYYIIFFFPEEDVIVLTNKDYKVREIITKEGVEVMNLNQSVIDDVRKRVDYYKLGDGSKVKVTTRKKLSK